jgi:hypothetical protein
MQINIFGGRGLVQSESRHGKLSGHFGHYNEVWGSLNAVNLTSCVTVTFSRSNMLYRINYVRFGIFTLKCVKEGPRSFAIRKAANG